MPGGPSAVVLKDLHTLFQVGTAGGLTDGQLIERFLDRAMMAATPHFGLWWNGMRRWSCASAMMS